MLVRGLNVLLATVSTPQAAPVICGIRLRGGTANSARGAEPFVREAIGAAKAAGAGTGRTSDSGRTSGSGSIGGIVVVRADSAFYSAGVIAACRDNHVCFSVTATMDKKIKAAIAAIPESSWTAIQYPDAVFDEQAGR